MKNVNTVIKNLKEQNVKVTAQRLAVMNFLAVNPIHPSAEDIYKGIKELYPTISLATIYNTLDKLEVIGKVIKLKLSDNNKINYEYNLTPHNHFYCRHCEVIYDIWNKTTDKTNTVNDHLVEEEQIFYKGICKKCIERKG
ncbi:MAG: transcriptional repressor [bacterium]|nr:transcriptional repressor [bacterium]